MPTAWAYSICMLCIEVMVLPLSLHAAIISFRKTNKQTWMLATHCAVAFVCQFLNVIYCILTIRIQVMFITNLTDI